MDPNDSDPYSEIHNLRIQLLKKDEIAGALRNELKYKAIALEIAEERIRRLVAASQKKPESSVIAGSSSKYAGRNAESKPTAPKPEPISPQRRMVPYVSLPPPSRQLSTQPRTSTPPPPSHQNHESSTLEEMEVEDTLSMSPPPNMKLEPKSPHGHKRLIPYVSVPSPHQNHESATLDEMAMEDTPSMSPPPNMKLEPKSPHGHKRLVPYVSVPSRQMSVWPANKRPANDDITQGSPKLSTQRRKLGSGPPVKDEVPHATPKTRRTALISAKRHPPQVPTPATTSKRPKKEEHKVFSLPHSITDAYLKSHKPLTIKPSPIPLAVPRKLLRLAYGGSDQQFLQFLQPNTNPSSPTLRRMVWPQIEMNPLMPSTPGHPGIVFASRHEILENPPWTVWCRCLESPTAMWCYLGEYESELCGEMSAEQFRDQPQKAKEAWAELLIKGKAFDVYVAMRARIALRKHNIIPLERQVLVEDGKPETDEQVAVRSKSLEDDEMKAIKRNKGRKVESEDVIRAFSRGDEAIDIIRMRCVSYDHVFARDLQRQLDNYDQLLEREKEKKAAEEGKQGLSSKRKRKRKRKGVTRRGEKGKEKKGKGKARDATPSDDEDGERESEDDLEYADQASSSSRPRRKSTKWDANTGGRVVVGQEENDGDVEVLCGTGLEGDDDELSELTDSDSGADTD